MFLKFTDSMEAILQMTKLSGNLLKPYLDTLIPAVLESRTHDQHNLLCIQPNCEVKFVNLLDPEGVNKHYNLDISINVCIFEIIFEKFSLI